MTIRVRPTLLAALLALATTAAAPAAEPRELRIEAPDGTALAATYAAAPAPGPGVLLLHMCNSDRSAWTGLARELASRGIHSLALDYRGYGDSDGETHEDLARLQEDMARLWPGDIDAALAALLARPGVDGARIGVAGGSCGVDHAIQLARRQPGLVRTLVLLAGSTSPEGETFLAANPWLPLLASASRDDGQAVPMTRWTLEFSSHPANRFLEYATGGHGTEMFAVHAKLEPEIADWFVEHLVTRPVTRPERIVPRPGPSAGRSDALYEPGGPERVLAQLRAARARGEELPLPPEGVLNAEGYRRLGAGEVDGAIELLAFVVEAHPGSANALDSLGDAYAAAGDDAKAAELARRTLEALPGDDSIPDQFKEAIRGAAEAKLGADSPQS